MNTFTAPLFCKQIRKYLIIRSEITSIRKYITAEGKVNKQTTIASYLHRSINVKVKNM